MGFKTITSSKSLDVEEMRRKMKEQSASRHIDPLLNTPIGESNKPKSRKTVKNYTVHFSTYLTEEQSNALKKWCKDNGVTPAMAIRMAVIQMLPKE